MSRCDEKRTSSNEAPTPVSRKRTPDEQNVVVIEDDCKVELPTNGDDITCDNDECYWPNYTCRDLLCHLL